MSGGGSIGSFARPTKMMKKLPTRPARRQVDTVREGRICSSVASSTAMRACAAASSSRKGSTREFYREAKKAHERESATKPREHGEEMTRDREARGVACGMSIARENGDFESRGRFHRFAACDREDASAVRG